MVFSHWKQSIFYSDISSLAKAAVAGDESALDMLSWRKGNKNVANTASTDYSFFFGVVDGEYSFDFAIHWG